MTTETLPDALTGEQAIATVKADPANVLLKPELWRRFYAAIKDESEKTPVDLATKKGRELVASAAYKITQTKTLIDKSAKAMKSAINDQQKKVYAELDDLAVATRAPLTVWEANEKRRQDLAKEIVDRMRRMAEIKWDDTSDAVIMRLCDLEIIELDPETFGDELEQAQETQRQAVETMNAAITRLEKEEADKAELKRLQDAETDRLAAEAETQRLADEAQAQRDAAEFDTEAARVTVTEMAPVMMVGPAGTFASEASIAAAAMPTAESAPPPSAARQSTVSEPSTAAEDARRATQTALVEYAGLQRAEAFNVVQAIIDGHIPNLTFKEPS